MFSESKCGCIWSIKQGRVRICSTHKIELGDGAGGWNQLMGSNITGVMRKYPANGVTVAGWSGK